MRSTRTRIMLWLATGAGALAMVSCGAPPAKAPAPVTAEESEARAPLDYPATRSEDVVDTLHGVEVADPYRWLEDDESEEVKKWQEAQTALARGFLDQIPGRDAVRERIAEVYRVDMEETPVRRGEYYFQKKRKAAEDQPVLYVSKGFPGEQRALIDPNADKDNTVALDWWYPSWDGTLLAHGLSSSGSERSTLYVIDTATGKRLDDRIPNTRSAKVAWLPDNSGFFYSRRPDPESDATYFNKVYFHELGDEWEDDRLVFGADSADDAIHWPTISPDGKQLVILVFRGAGGINTELWYRQTAKTGKPFEAVAKDLDASFYPDVKNDKLVVLTNYKASRYRVIEIDYRKPGQESWHEIIPEGEDTIDQILIIKDHIVVKVMHDAAIRLYLHDATGKRLSEIPLPTLGTAHGLSGRFEDEEFFYGFTSFVHAGDIYRYGLDAGESELVSRISVPIEPERYLVEQVFFTSKDGTKVPMFVARLKDLDVSAPRPTLLTAYGGFNIALTPYFLGKFLPFIESGGIFAMPNLRGGSEYGEEWHRAGMLGNKQNVFDDFIGAAEYLIERGLTTPEQLGIRGGSNGGLLVGAVMTQRPELYGAVICAVPLLDMVRYHKFLIAKLWIPEYGSADDPDQFPYLHAYSPYHHVEEGAKYPSTLFLTAEADSRVAPLHARKMAALLQAKTGGTDPILLRVESKAGHGKGKPISMRIDDTTDIIAFLMYETGLLGAERD